MYGACIGTLISVPFKLIFKYYNFLLNLNNVLYSQFLIIMVAELPKVGPVRPEDVETALRNTRPSAHLHAHKYDKFNSDYGSQILQ
jgi:hypothetical protein